LIVSATTWLRTAPGSATAGRAGAVYTHAEEAGGDETLALLSVGERGLWIALSRAREFIPGKFVR